MVNYCKSSAAECEERNLREEEKKEEKKREYNWERERNAYFEGRGLKMGSDGHWIPRVGTSLWEIYGTCKTETEYYEKKAATIAAGVPLWSPPEVLKI